MIGAGSHSPTEGEMLRTLDAAKMTRNSLFLQELIEQRAGENQLKNKLRKILFKADPEKQGVMPVDEFYRLLKENGPLELSEAQKARIRKLFVIIKDGTLPYSTVLKSLEFSKEQN